ncbi:MAG: phytanoyl-CoA dioxygenase family protein [Alphaproteobacteria bacterium]|nr:phytanoyl-CoA dioxygenase family protein [Alphaproteobacteria bacterium]
MSPGDLIAFHDMVVHGAPRNLGAANRRRVLSTIWLGDDAVYATRPGPVRPLFEGHGLKPGDAMDSPYFPRVWPRRADAHADARFTDPAFRVSI